MECENLPSSVTDKSIILDMDETLIHSFERDISPGEIDIEDSNNYDIRDRIYFFKYRKFGSKKIIAVKRPYLDDFIEFCEWYFKYVIIWSAGEDTYVKENCKKIFNGHRKPWLILTREKCHGYDMTKPLKYLIENNLLNNEITYKNAIIVDDRESTFLEDNPENAIHIPQFTIPSLSPRDIRTSNDDSLLKIILWLQNGEVLTSSDVRTLDKREIFQ